MAGTQAAADTLFNRDVMGPLLSQFGNADGSLNPFEILIETRSFGSDSPQASIVATRVYQETLLTDGIRCPVVTSWVSMGASVAGSQPAPAQRVRLTRSFIR